MSHIPLKTLQQLSGLGSATPESLAAQGLEAERQAKAFRSMGPDYAVQANQFQVQADSLFAAAKALHAKKAGVSAKPAPPATARSTQASVQSTPRRTTALPTYTAPQREPFGVGFDSKIKSLLSELVGESRPQPPAMTVRTVPTWVWVAGAAVAASLLGAALAKSRR